MLASQIQLFESRPGRAPCFTETSPSRYCGQAGGNRAVKRCLFSLLEMQIYTLWGTQWPLECSAMSSGTLAVDIDLYLGFMLTKATLIGTGDQPCCPFFAAGPGQHTQSFPKACLHSWLTSWPLCRAVCSKGHQAPAYILFYVLCDRVRLTIQKEGGGGLWVRTQHWDWWDA